MDSHLEDVYESSQGADIDDLDGFEWGSDDETDDEDDDRPFLDVEDAEILPSSVDVDDAPMPEWPTAADKAEYEIYKPVPLTDEELEEIRFEYERWGDEQDIRNGIG